MLTNIQNVVQSLEKDHAFSYDQTEFERFYVQKDRIIRIDHEDSNVVEIQRFHDDEDPNIMWYLVTFEDGGSSCYRSTDRVFLEMYIKLF